MLACKVLSSRACELASVKEMEMSLKDRDPGFVKVCQTFILCMRRAGEIVPFDRCWIAEGYKFIGVATSLDGGRCGYGITTHILAEKDKEEGDEKSELRRGLVITRSKICVIKEAVKREL